jgi:hypothetical protein
VKAILRASDAAACLARFATTDAMTTATITTTIATVKRTNEERLSKACILRMIFSPWGVALRRVQAQSEATDLFDA